MDKFRQALILKYFFDKGNNYTISEVMKLLGLTLNQIDDNVNILLKKEYIRYANNLVLVTKKGRRFIVSESVENISFAHYDNSREIETKKKPMNIDEIYIPKNFLERV